jgi:lysyl-tRNA synthetase class 2
MPVVDSSAIRAVGYNANLHELAVMFVTDRIYIYLGVPEAIYEALMRAPSKGRFFNAEIRDRYAFRERGK